VINKDLEMTQGANPILDNISRLMTDAAGVATGMRREAEGVMRSQLERLVRDMDVVTREEFEAVREIAIRAREESEALKARLDALESGMKAK
jgi:BMFP domain-containing protein YqiC